MSIIITVHQTARRHMPEERNFVHFYLLLCVYVIVLCRVDKIRNSSNPVKKKNLGSAETYCFALQFRYMFRFIMKAIYIMECCKIF